MTVINVQAQCPHPCTRIYKPVCGEPVNGVGPFKTFSNKCMIISWNCDYPDNGKVT